MKAKALIEDAYVELGIIPAGSELAALDLKWATRKFNSFLKSKSVDGLNLHYMVQEDFTLTPGTASYTIGIGGVFDTVRPNAIKDAFILDINNHSYAVGVRPIEEYWYIPEKDTQDRPRWLYYDRTFPLGTLYLYYTPNASETLRLISFKPLETYDEVAVDDVEVPGEYEEMFISNLALRVAPRYGRQPTRELQETAHNTLQAIRGSNMAKSITGVNLNILPRNGYQYYNVEES